jgi:hypothetical protein
MRKTTFVKITDLAAESVEMDRPSVKELAKRLDQDHKMKLADREVEKVLILNGEESQDLARWLYSALGDIETLSHLGKVFFLDMNKSEMDAESTEEHLSRLIINIHEKVRHLDMIACNRLGGTLV